MNNLNEPSQILTPKLFVEFMRAFNIAWTKETAFYTEQKEWSLQNKALGQCAPTALIIYDYFGGKIVYDKGNFHVWNVLSDGSNQDFSRIQFKDERDFVIYKYLTKEEMLTNEVGAFNNTKHKYALLSQRFLKLVTLKPLHH